MNRLKVFAIGSLVAGVLLAQPQLGAAQVVLGAKVGATFSNVDQDPEEFDSKRLTSFGGGGFLRFGLAGLSLQAELLALTKGTKFEDADESIELKLDYIEVPLLLRFGLSSGTGFMPYLMAGPSVGFEIGCSFDVESTFGDASGDCDEDGDDNFLRNKTDIGLTGVVGFEFAAGPGNILVEGRYTHGLTDISKDTDKARNRSFGIFAGYAVPLGSR